MSTPIVTSVTTTSEQISQETPKLEPFPYQPEPERSRRSKCPPPRSPSKFVKGEFRESDYESDYEGKIQQVWGSDSEKTYRPVRPVLTPSGRHSHASRVRTPTPPTEFDNPPQIIGPARPKFEPIDKPKKTIKVEEIAKPLPKQTVFKPKPIPARPVEDVIVATPAVPLQPGSPPEIAYAPGPVKTQYYRSTTSAPYHNAVQTETSNIMHFNESTEHSHRTVSLQQTTKVIKFGEQSREASESYQYRTEPAKVRRSSAPPPCRPKKFIPGEFRESDYESEVDSAKIKVKWVPGGSDSEEPHYRKVRAPASVRSSSAPAPKERVITPMEFDTQPPEMPSKISTNEFKKKTEKFESKGSSLVKRGSEYTAPERIMKTTATKMASQHMDSMTRSFKDKTQRFVSDIMNDVNKTSQQKPILKANDGEAQVYREESRAAQYG